jgi:uncharacterized protein related to proFAR isomerase
VADADRLRELVRDFAYVAALALIQAKGDPANALARLETMRGLSVVREAETGFEADVVQIAQAAITAAAASHDLDDPECSAGGGAS